MLIISRSPIYQLPSAKLAFLKIQVIFFIPKRLPSINNALDKNYKIPKLSAEDNVRTTRKVIGDDEDSDDELTAGPEVPLDQDEVAIDEEGRFYGGGITSGTAEVLNFIDERDNEDFKVGLEFYIGGI